MEDGRIVVDTRNIEGQVKVKYKCFYNQQSRRSNIKNILKPKNVFPILLASKLFERIP